MITTSLPVPHSNSETDPGQQDAVEPYNAIVFGSTGAVGKEVVRVLAESNRCLSVLAIVRRSTQLSEWKADGDSSKIKLSKVEVKRINYDTLETSLPESQLRTKQVAFYCLGTTRKDAGSAEAFQKVDFDYLFAVCKLCRVGGVDHFSVVSAQGASANSPLLYPKTKGRGENVVKEAGYPHTSVWKPGLLGSGEKARGMQKMSRLLIAPMPVETLARAMVVDVESRLGTDSEAEAAVFTNKAIRRLAAQFAS